MEDNVLLIHKGKHHIYYSLKGLSKSVPNAKGYFAMYDNNKFLRFILKKLGREKQINGYKLKEIDQNVITNFLIKILFLLSRQKVIFQSFFSNYFEYTALKYMKKFNYVHVIQDYTNKVIREAKKQNKVVIYEQIIADSMTQRRYLHNEILKWGFSLECLDKIIPLEKAINEKENLMLVDYIHVPSKFVEENVLDIIGYENKHKVVYWPYGVDVNNFKFKLRNYDGGRTLKLICISRINLLKGTKYLIEAMRSLEKYDVHLTFIGLCMDDEYMVLAEELKQLGNVTYIESIPHSEINRYYQESDMLVLPSLIEGSSLVVYEALSCGLPVIVTPNAGSVITNGVEGILINAQSSEEIVNSVVSILEEPEKLATMSTMARETVEKYSWSRYVENMEVFYKKILGCKGEPLCDG